MLGRRKKTQSPDPNQAFQFGFDFGDSRQEEVEPVVDAPVEAFVEVPEHVPPLLPDAPDSASVAPTTTDIAPSPAPEPAAGPPAPAPLAVPMPPAQGAVPAPPAQSAIPMPPARPEQIPDAQEELGEDSPESGEGEPPKEKKSFAQWLGLNRRRPTSDEPSGEEPEPEQPSERADEATPRPKSGLLAALGLRRREDERAAVTEIVADQPADVEPQQQPPRRGLAALLGLSPRRPAEPDTAESADPGSETPSASRTAPEPVAMHTPPMPAEPSAEQTPETTHPAIAGEPDTEQTETTHPAIAGEPDTETKRRRSLADFLGLSRRSQDDEAADAADDDDAPRKRSLAERLGLSRPSASDESGPLDETSDERPAKRSLAARLGLGRRDSAPQETQPQDATTPLVVGEPGADAKPGLADRLGLSRRKKAETATSPAAGNEKPKRKRKRGADRPAQGKKPNPLLAAMGLSTKSQPAEGSGRIIRLDEPERPNPSAERIQSMVAQNAAKEDSAGRERKSLFSKRNKAADGEKAAEKARRKAAKKKARAEEPRTFGMPPAVAVVVVAALGSFGLLAFVIPRVASQLGYELPVARAQLLTIAAALTVIAAAVSFIREQGKRPPHERFRLSTVKQKAQQLAGKRADDVPENMPVAFMGSDMDDQRTLFERVLNNVLPSRGTVGLDIGASALRAAVVRDGIVLSVATRPMPPGIIVDGLLVDAAGFSRELRALWQQANFGTNEVNFSIANRAVALRTLTLAAATDQRDLELAVATNADTVLRPMKTEDSIIDYAELSRTGSRVALQLAAADEAMVKRYVAAVQGAGLTPVSCELGPLAEGRALIMPRRQGVAHGVVNIGAEKTTFICASGTDIFFLRVVEIGGNDFTRAIEAAMQCTWEQAEQLKLRSGLDVEPVDPNLDYQTFAVCQTAMQRVADRLVQELAGTPRLFEELQEGRPVSGMTLTGGGALLAGLAEQISMFVNVPELTPVQGRPGLEIDDLPMYASALGLALGHRMSLMPDVKGRSFAMELPGRRRRPKVSADRTKRQARRLKAGARKQTSISPATIGLLVGIIALGGSYMYGTRIKTENDELRAQVESVEATQAQAKTQAVAPAYTGAGARDAQIVGNALVRNPDHQVGAQLARLVDEYKVADAQITIANQGYTVTGELPDAQRDTFLTAIKDGVGGVKDASLTPNGANKFSVNVTSPADTSTDTSTP